jgi:hypothetical protein
MSAMGEATTVAAGVTREEYFWGYILEGSKEALLRSGSARKQWFATGRRRDSRGRVVRTIYVEHEGRQVRCTDIGHGYYSVTFRFSESERVQREQDHQERSDAERGPKSAEEFRKQCDTVAGWNLFAVHKLAGYKAGKHVRFRYDDETLEAIHIEAAKILDLVRNGRILKLRGSSNPERMDQVRAAERDAGFQKFLGKLPKD